MKYYDGSKALNSNCPFIFSVGNRGTGKSFNWKRHVVRRYLKNGEEFIYIRRTGKDLERCLPTWFDDIRNKFDDDLDVVIEKNRFYMVKYGDDDNIISKKLFGYAFSLGETIKSIPFEKVETIFFDEFLPDDGRYLHPSNPNWEAEQILNIYMTVARGFGQVVRDSVRLICCANNISIYNPYFTYYGIDLSSYEAEQYYSTINDGVFTEIVYNPDVAEEMEKSKIGGILGRTRYGQHATKNASLLDNKFNIMKPPQNVRYEFSLYTAFGWISAWSDCYGNCYWRETYDKQHPRKYKTQPIPEYPFSVPYFQGDVLNNLKKLFINDRMFYENGKVKSAVVGLFISGSKNLNYM